MRPCRSDGDSASSILPADKASIDSVVTHVARFVSMGQLPSSRIEATRNSTPFETTGWSRCPLAARLMTTKEVSGAASRKPPLSGWSVVRTLRVLALGQMPNRPGERVARLEMPVSSLPDGDQRGQSIAHDRQTQPLEQSMRKSRQFKGQRPNQPPCPRPFAQSARQGTHRQDRHGERAVFAILQFHGPAPAPPVRAIPTIRRSQDSVFSTDWRHADGVPEPPGPSSTASSCSDCWGCPRCRPSRRRRSGSRRATRALDRRATDAGSGPPWPGQRQPWPWTGRCSTGVPPNCPWGLGARQAVSPAMRQWCPPRPFRPSRRSCGQSPQGQKPVIGVFTIDHIIGPVAPKPALRTPETVQIVQVFISRVAHRTPTRERACRAVAVESRSGTPGSAAKGIAAKPPSGWARVQASESRIRGPAA